MIVLDTRICLPFLLMSHSKFLCVKYIGHADVTMGCVTTNSQDLYKKMQENQICECNPVLLKLLTFSVSAFMYGLCGNYRYGWYSLAI